jgi:type I restriction enzyme S subunit
MSQGGTVVGSAKAVTDAGIASKRLPVGDPGTVLLAMYATVGAAATLGIRATWNQAILGIVPNPEHADARFLRYWLQAVRPEWTAAVRSNTQDNLNAETVGNAVLPPIPTTRQRAIADYLDAETARIDDVIAARRRQFELVEARVESYIAAELDALVRRRGERPLKSVADIRFSSVDKKSYDDEEPVRLCNYTDVYYHRRIDSSLDFMGATASRDQIARFSLQSGDVLLTKDSETAEDIAVSALVVEDLPGVVLGYHLAMARPTRIHPPFLYWALTSRRCRDAFSLAASGVTRYGLRQDAVGRVPVPNVDHQVAVALATAIATTITRSDQVAATLRRQVELLVERRQVLIAAAVAGQLDIPGVAA